MSKATVRVLAQYYENYSENGTAWKPKGAQHFEIEIDSDSVMYLENQVVAAIKKILANHSNSHCKYEYVEHEVIFSKPVIIDEAEFEAAFQAELA